MTVFDYVIAGAGSAGCILAARLSEDPKVTVLLVEAGGSDSSPWFRIPVGYARSYYDPRVNWMYWTEPEAELGGRRIYAPRGKVLGGSGSINAMIYVRGAATDFDDWAAGGNPGWGAADVLPFFKKLETHAAGEGPWHGGSGPIHITPMRGDAHPLTDHFLEAAHETGLPLNPDFNGETLEGAGIYDINTRRGMRSSSARAYLRPALRRPNLRVLRHSEVARVLIDSENRATGVVVDTPGGPEEFGARAEVILSAGAVGTPAILQRSGIGDSTGLGALGIAPRHHLPQVGQNLQDHLCVSFYYRAHVPTLNDELRPFLGKVRHAIRYALSRRGALALSVNQAGGFFKGSPGRERPNLQLYFNPLSYRIPADPRAGLTPEPYSGFLLAFNSCRPTSRGSVEIASADRRAPPRIRPNYLSTEADRLEAIEGSRLVRRLMAAKALAEVTDRELPPSADALTDGDLLAHFRENCGSIYHLCGSARMGRDATDSVVDSTLRVHGIRHLRIADASVFPNITSGNINAPTMMVAEKAADLIRRG